MATQNDITFSFVQRTFPPGQRIVVTHSVLLIFFAKDANTLLIGSKVEIDGGKCFQPKIDAFQTIQMEQ